MKALETARTPPRRVRFLIDESVSGTVAELLTEAGHDAVHVGHFEMLGARDEMVMATALEHDRVLVFADTDFGALLAQSGASGPSVILFRREGRRPSDQAALLLANIDSFRDPLEDDFIAVVGRGHVRVCPLPIERRSPPGK